MKPKPTKPDPVLAALREIQKTLAEIKAQLPSTELDQPTPARDQEWMIRLAELRKQNKGYNDLGASLV